MSDCPYKVWFITGASKPNGLGRALALAAIVRGDKVIVSARSSEDLQDLQDHHPESCRALQLDLAETFEKICEKSREAVAIWGNIDVLVNNAATTLIGNVEELGGDGFEEVYKINIIGTLNITNALLPYMRERRSGTVVFIGSRSVWRTDIPMTSIYTSSKAAIHAISDTLSQELFPFNIRVLNVAPGGMRTDVFRNLPFTTNKSLARPYDRDGIVTTEVPEYANARIEGARWAESVHGSQPGDPKKVAMVITDIVRGEGVAKGKAWPGTIYLGDDAENDVRAKCASILKTLDDWHDVSRSIGFD